MERVSLNPFNGNFFCVVSANTWHTVEVLEPSVIYEAKDGCYNSENGLVSYDDYLVKQKQTSSSPDNCIGDLKQ